MYSNSDTTLCFTPNHMRDNRNLYCGKTIQEDAHSNESASMPRPESYNRRMAVIRQLQRAQILGGHDMMMQEPFGPFKAWPSRLRHLLKHLGARELANVEQQSKIAAPLVLPQKIRRHWLYPRSWLPDVPRPSSRRRHCRLRRHTVAEVRHNRSLIYDLLPWADSCCRVGTEVLLIENEHRY